MNQKETPTEVNGVGSLAGTIDNASLVAPELIDAEVLSVLRRQVLGGKLEEATARLPISALLLWPIERISHRIHAPLAWEHYQNISAYDALYVATARARDLPLLTVDARLSRASGLDIVIRHVHMR